MNGTCDPKSGGRGGKGGTDGRGRRPWCKHSTCSLVATTPLLTPIYKAVVANTYRSLCIRCSRIVGSGYWSSGIMDPGLQRDYITLVMFLRASVPGLVQFIAYIEDVQLTIKRTSICASSFCWNQQLYLHTSVSSVVATNEQLPACSNDVHEWRATRRQRLNADKNWSHMFRFSYWLNSASCPPPTTLLIVDVIEAIPSSQVVRELGVLFDSEVTMHQQVYEDVLLLPSSPPTSATPSRWSVCYNSVVLSSHPASSWLLQCRSAGFNHRSIAARSKYAAIQGSFWVFFQATASPQHFYSFIGWR
jgi:hypothetical protein